MKLGLVDVNQYLEERGSKYRFSLVMYDTKLDTVSAKSSIQRAFSEYCIRMIIGPQSSAEVGAIRQYAEDNKILVVSQGSTASSLAIENDAVFRLCPGDAVEANAISRTMYNSGKRVVITLARNDAGNVGLQNNVGIKFAALGGTVDAIPPYDPNLTDFTSIIQQLKTKIQQYSTANGNNKVAVYYAAFDESVNLFRAAVNDPDLTAVNWYGGDGMVQSETLAAYSDAAEFAIKTNFFAPNFGLPVDAHPDLARISNAIKQATGIEPDAYALSVYDAMWILARTISSYPGVLNDFSLMKTSFTHESNQFYGITGPVTLNNFGDRGVGAFDYWGIVKENGKYLWKVVGKSN